MCVCVCVCVCVCARARVCPCVCVSAWAHTKLNERLDAQDGIWVIPAQISSVPH